MSKAILALSTAALAIMGSCGRQPLVASPDAGPGTECGCGGQGGHSVDLGGLGDATGGGSGGGTGGSTGKLDASLGTGGTVLIHVPDGGISSLLGDSGIIGAILDAPRDSILGLLLCGPEAKLGAPCPQDGSVCVLPSLGGACTCVRSTYICPVDTTTPAPPCPAGAASGMACLSPLSLCIGNGANACLCAFPSYICI